MEKFDVRNPLTWTFATNAPLIIDGVSIYQEIYDNSKPIKETVSEKSFVKILTAMAKIEGKARAWDKAVERAKAEWEAKGIKNPNDGTPGYVDRINEIYTAILNRPHILDKNQINKYIDEKILECTTNPVNKNTIYGGYKFSPAQLEVLGGYSQETLEKIGKIMSTNKSDRKLKQEIFNTLGIDGEWAVRLRYSEPLLEEWTMKDYFLSCEFETEEEVHQFFDSSEYLKTHQEIKREVVANALQLL